MSVVFAEARRAPSRKTNHTYHGLWHHGLNDEASEIAWGQNKRGHDVREPLTPPPASSPPVAAKKPYSTPELCEFGGVRELTATLPPSGGSNGDDGGTQPNIYISD
jgi:hypothetical protein